MTAIKKEELARLERKHGLEEDGLTYQQRCSRITAVMKGEKWTKPEKKTGEYRKPWKSDARKHPLYGKRILITPMMVPDAKRNLAFDEPIGHYMETENVDAGELLYNRGDQIDRMVGDYKIVNEDVHKTIYAKTTFPKIGTEISWLLGREICPTVRGNDGKKGYLWSYPTSMIQVGDTLIQVYGLKTLIETVYPELLVKFSGKPMMDYVDGVTLVASIPLTDALLKEQRIKELANEKAGLV